MAIDRLRAMPTTRELDRMYATPHDHHRWPDHVLRVKTTLAMAEWVAGPVESAADLSAGNGWLLDRIEADRKVYGDYAATAPGWLRGPIEQTIERLDRVNLLLCCETLEHLDDPVEVLRQIRAKTDVLVLSTPLDAWRDSNPEHLWAWNREGIEGLLSAAGFRVAAFATSDARSTHRGSYLFGIWGCR